MASLTLGAPLLGFAAAAWSRRFMVDDGYIYIRVVDQLLAGHGPVFNQGERVEATTSPLWLGILSVTKLVLPPISTPRIAVLLGMLFSLGGLAFAQWGAHQLWKSERRIMLPLGSAVVVALPPFWEFATSGLETGLAFAWLGACFWGLVRLLPPKDDRSGPMHPEPRTSNVKLPGIAPPMWLPVLIGLGVLVRPDFGLFVGAFMIVLFFLCRGGRRASLLRAAAFALAIPFAYQVFRMGYYAELVPNPALAKEASSADWSRGWIYLLDTMKPYWLPLPLVVSLGLGLMPWPPRLTRREPWLSERALLVAAVVGAGLAHGLYVIYVGGDFMHGRMLLPAIFALVMPVAVVGLDAVPRVVAVVGVLVWAVVCAATLRVPYRGVGPDLIANEHDYYVTRAHVPHPITLYDYRADPSAWLGGLARAKLLRGNLMLDWTTCPTTWICEQIRLRPGVPAYGVIEWPAIGIFSNTVGIDIHIVDNLGLADPLGSHLGITKRGRAGHDKLMPDAWVVARFADPTALIPAGGPSAVDVAAAREALDCGDIPELLAAVSKPMTPARFAHNLLDAFRFYRFRIPPDPQQARKELC